MLQSQKHPNAGIMRFWKTKSKSNSQMVQTNATEQPSGFTPNYLRLEQRTLLSATFATFGTTELVLNDFDTGQNLDFGQQNAIVNGISQDSFVFQVSTGSFNGNISNPLIELESINGGTNNQLEIATSFFQGGATNADLTIDGLSANGTNVEFTQSSNTLTFDTLQLSNFANDNRDFDLTANGDVTLDNVTVFDSNPNDGIAAPATLDVSVTGNLNLAGQTGNLISNPNANVDLTATGNISMASGSELTSQQAIDISSTNGSVTLADVSAGTDIQVQAANNITQQTGSEITATTTVDLTANNGSVSLADVSAGADVQVQAANNITQQTGSEITAANTVDLIANNGSVSLADVSAGADVQVQAANNITQRSGTEVNAATTVDFIANNGAVTLADISTGDALQIQAADDITQQTGSDIVVGSSATISSTSGDILLAAAPNQTITVEDQASFTANQIEIGIDGQPAGSPTATNVRLGSVTLNASQAVLVEDDSTTLVGNSDVDNLFVSSGQSISNSAGASLVADNAQLNAATNVVVGNQADDSFLLGQVSVIADNAHLEVDGDLRINGIQPTAANSQPIATGTNVDQSLFVIADGSVEQTQGDLLAQQIGIEATEYVHLTSIAAANQAIAISAGGSTLLTDPALNATLESLAAVENGEVDANRPQAIAIAHRGDANVTNVTSITGSDSLTGFNSTDGSISVFADQAISLQQDITAFSPAADPQITLYSAAGDETNPSIFFNGGQASVTGPTNIGVVNSNQAFANFFDDDGFLFEDTTQILTLNTDGTVSQDIVIEYGQLGEVGFRIGVIFDSQNQPLNPIEDLNLFTPSNTVDSEAFEDDIFQQNTVIRALIGGNEGGRETITQVDDFTAQAVISHFDNPNVFTDIIVRNDQDINLFTGPLATVDNSLNEVRQQILSVFDLPRGATPFLPAINPINSIEVRSTFDLPFDSPPPLDQTDSIFSREVTPFEEGELRWVQVEIPVDELEMVGDEVSLKQPSKLYPNGSDSTEQVFQNVGENETERIIDQIERSPIAEPGYWFKVFKAYDHSGDELFYYHYKTGETNDVTPELDTNDVTPEPDTAGGESPAAENSDQFEPQTDPDSDADVNVFSIHQTTDSETSTTSRLAISDNVLLELLRRPTELAEVEHDSPTADAVSTENYDHLSRLKRKLKRCL